MRYILRTLLFLLAVLPPLLWIGWTKYEAWRAEQERQKAISEHVEWLIWTEQVAPLIIYGQGEPSPRPDLVR